MLAARPGRDRLGVLRHDRGHLERKSPYPRLQNAQHHSEFVFGFDFSLFVDGLVASCSWDRHVAVWNYFGVLRRRRRVKFALLQLNPPYLIIRSRSSLSDILIPQQTDMETPKKTGFWTQHTDPSSGVSACISSIDSALPPGRVRSANGCFYIAKFGVKL